MGTTQDHRKYAEECVAMARASGEDKDKVLWLALAQSWMRLADHVAHAPSPEQAENPEHHADSGQGAPGPLMRRTDG
jgi:hypothetical protein